MYICFEKELKSELDINVELVVSSADNLSFVFDAQAKIFL